MPQIHVLKFGSSVLRSPQDLPAVTAEIARFRETLQPVVAVVSAFAGETDRRIAEADRLGLDSHSPTRAALIAEGEWQSALALTDALKASGARAAALSPADIGLRAKGPRTDGHPVAANMSVLRTKLDEYGILIIPGYSGLDREGNAVLFGRGGSDMTALYLAHALGQPSCRLIKDVDGLYERDPNRFPDARRYETVSTRTAYEVGGVLVQPKAIAFAEAHPLTIEVATMGQAGGSRVFRGAVDLLEEKAKDMALVG